MFYKFFLIFLFIVIFPFNLTFAGASMADFESVSKNLSPDEKNKAKAAFSEAEKWLNLLEQGNCPESWKQFTGLQKKSLEFWETECKDERAKLGKMVSRKLLSVMSDVMFLPEEIENGEFKFTFIFEGKFDKSGEKIVKQNVSVLRFKDGRWMIGLYMLSSK